MEESDVELTVQLFPIDVQQPLRGIKAFLNNRLNQYYPEVGGILVSYSNIRVRQRQFLTLTDLPHYPIRILVAVKVFAPRCGALLTVTVNDVRENVVFCLAANKYNVTVQRNSATSPDMIGFEYEVGQRLEVLVKNMYTEHGSIQLVADPLALERPRKRKRMKTDNDSDSHVG